MTDEIADNQPAYIEVDKPCPRCYSRRRLPTAKIGERWMASLVCATCGYTSSLLAWTGPQQLSTAPERELTDVDRAMMISRTVQYRLFPPNTWGTQKRDEAWEWQPAIIVSIPGIPVNKGRHANLLILGSGDTYHEFSPPIQLSTTLLYEVEYGIRYGQWRWCPWDTPPQLSNGMDWRVD